MGRNLFASPAAQPQGEAPAQSQPQGQPSAPSKGRNIFQAPQYDDFRAPPPIDFTGYSKQDLLEAYKNLPKDDPRREQVKAELVNGATENLNREGMGGWGSFATGTMEGASLGFSDEINAGLTGLTGGLYSPLGGKTYEEELKNQRDQLRYAQEDNPGPYFTGQLSGAALQAIPTLGMSIPETMGMRLLTNVAGGAAQGGTYAFGEDNGDLSSRLGAGAEGALWGAGFGMVPTAGEAIWKGGKALAGGTAKIARKLTNPARAVEDDLVDRGVRDRVAQFRNEQNPNPPDRRFLTQEEIDAAIARGDDVMVSDLLGDGGRRRLKAAANVSEDASNLMQGAARGRQKVQGQTFMDTLSDITGDVDPASTVGRLKKMAQEENDAAYGMVENHPNASHLWNNRLQRAISTPEGKEALKDAILNSRREAINNGEDIFEPIFEEGPDGLMRWSGQFRRPTGELVDDVQGLGLGFRFWDSVKKSFDDKITSLYKGGFNEEAKAIRKTRDQMLETLDNQLSDGNGNSLYKNARGTAKEFFDAEDAHEAGIKYFSNMGAFKTSETRAAIAKFTPSERELFARGYAASLMHKVSSMGEGEEVAKLFRDPLSRRKLQDALGPALADQLEVITQARAVQGMLGRELQSGSSTVLQHIAQEGMKYTASSSAGAGLGYYQTGDYTGLFLGMAAGAGFRFTQRKVVERYANALSQLATTRDPAVIARISKRIADDPRMMEFTRAVGAGAQRFGAGGSRASGNAAAGAGNAPQGATTINIPGGDLPVGAQRIEPRLFADGGLVEDDRVPFGGGGSVLKKVMELMGEQMALPVSKRIKPNGLEPIFDFGRDAHLETLKTIDQKSIRDQIPTLAQGKKGPLGDRIGPVRENTSALAAAIADDIAPAIDDKVGLFYHTEPVYDGAARGLGSREAGNEFMDRFSGLYAGTSPRTATDQNLRNASLLHVKQMNGIPFDQRLTPGDGMNDLGYPMMQMHTDLASRFADGSVDINRNTKPYLFKGNVKGNLSDVTADTHNIRSILGKLEEMFPGQMPEGWLDGKAAKQAYRDTGKLDLTGGIDDTMKQAAENKVKRQVEYGPMSDVTYQVAEKLGIPPAQAQALMWFKYGPKTGLKSPPKTFPELVNERVNVTAQALGIAPEKAWQMILRGDIPMMADGGLVTHQ